MTKTSEINEFFIELGKLLYSIAMADGEIQPEEKSAIFNLVKNELSEICKKTDEFGTNLAFYTAFSFEALEEMREPLKVTFHSFINYIEKSKGKLDKKYYDLCIESVNKIAESSEGISSSERKLIDDFKFKIRQLQIE